jgi:hypothetical protein
MDERMQDNQGAARFEAHVSKGRMWLIIFLALGFAVVGIWFVNAAVELSQTVRFVFFRDPIILRVFGWAAVAIGIVGAAVGVRQLFRTGPVIEADERGLRWRRWSDSFIPWSAITDATPRAIGRQQFLCLTLDQPERYKGKSLSGLVAGMNKNMGYGDVTISMQGTDRTMQDLLDAVARLRVAASR